MPVSQTTDTAINYESVSHITDYVVTGAYNSIISSNNARINER